MDMRVTVPVCAICSNRDSFLFFKNNGSSGSLFYFGGFMSDFPSIQKPSSRTRVFSKPQLKGDFEAGYTQVRAKATRAKQKWTLSWDHLPVADWDTLRSHFNDNSGNTFYIAAGMIGEVMDALVIYSIDEISANSSTIPGYYNVEIQVETP